MAGQAHRFLRYAPQQIEYALHRLRTEVARLYRLMDRQLERHEYLAEDYSNADIAAWAFGGDYPQVKRWFEAVGGRPAVRRGAQAGQDWVNFTHRSTTPP